MKTKTILYLFIFLSLNALSQKQILSGKITYLAELKFDENKIKENLKKMKGSKELKEKMIKDLYISNTKLNFELVFNKQESIFKKISGLDEKMTMVSLLAGNGIYHTTKKPNIVLIQKEAFGQLFLVKTTPLKWKLTQEFKTINKYICYKATTERIVENNKGKKKQKITAWFTTSIPVNFAPKDFSGLPGLILKLEIGKLNYTASNVELSFKETIKINKPKKGKKVTLKEFDNIARSFARSY